MFGNKHKGDFMSSSNKLSSFLTGAVLGAAAGILLAPRSGEETRKFLKEESQTLKESTLKAIQENKDKALDSIAKAYSQAEQLGLEASQRLEQLREITENTLDDQKKILQKGVSEAKKTIVSN